LNQAAESEINVMIDKQQNEMLRTNEDALKAVNESSIENDSKADAACHHSFVSQSENLWSKDMNEQSDYGNNNAFDENKMDIDAATDEGDDLKDIELTPASYEPFPPHKQTISDNQDDCDDDLPQTQRAQEHFRSEVQIQIRLGKIKRNDRNDDHDQKLKRKRNLS
jgi:hypothetical protein